MTDSELRREARRRLKARSGFWSFVGVWAVVSFILTGIWAITSPGQYFWPVWAIFGMGIAALFIGLDAHGPARRFHTEADVDAEVERMTGRRLDPDERRGMERDEPQL